LGTNRVILEMGSLYEPNLAGPLNTGTLCKLQLEGSGTCHVTIVAETTRGGVVLETGVTAEINVGAGCDVELGGGYPECWDYPGQCHGDATGDDRCDSYDWPAFRDGYYKNYWDHFPADPENPQPGEYNPCADYNRDGFVDSYDWPEFRDNYYTSVGGCATGDPYGVYLPGSTKP
jgi:hypothetical protein